MSTTTLTIDGVDLDITYSISPYREATLWEPEESAELDIEEVRCNGAEVLDLLSERVIDKIIEGIFVMGEETFDPGDFYKEEHCYH